MKSTKNIPGLVSLRGHHFYAKLVNSSSIVIDLGSHLGEFSNEVASLLGCKCYAVEALPSLYARIIETPSIKKFNYAISLNNNSVKFSITDNPEHNHIDKWSTNNALETITVTGISLESFMQQQQIEYIDLLKVDIEGAEIDLFQSMSDKTISKIKQITIEFHDFIFPIAKEVEIIKARLKSLGFTCIVFSRYNNGDVLFINNKYINIPFWEYLYIRHLAKYVRGSVKIMNRFIGNLAKSKT